MKCSKAISGIEAYLGATMAPRRRKRFEKHIALCSECSRELERCRQENRLYRQALQTGRLQASLRNPVLSRLPSELKPERAVAASRRRATLWIAPAAAVAQFLVAFWLAGALTFTSVPPLRLGVQTGDVVSVSWVRGMQKFKYFTLKRDAAIRGPVCLEKDMEVD